LNFGRAELMPGRDLPLGRLGAIESVELVGRPDVPGRRPEDFRSLRTLRDRSVWLRTLRLENTKVSKLEPLSDHGRLRWLRIENNPFLSDLSLLGTLRNLGHLRLGGREVKDIGFVRKLKKLRVLELHATGVSDLKPLAECPQLAELRISSSSAPDLAPLGKCSGLRYVGLTDMAVPDLQPLVPLKALRRLDLTNSMVRDKKAIAVLLRRGVEILGYPPVRSREGEGRRAK